MKKTFGNTQAGIAAQEQKEQVLSSQGNFLFGVFCRDSGRKRRKKIEPGTQGQRSHTLDSFDPGSPICASHYRAPLVEDDNKSERPSLGVTTFTLALLSCLALCACASTENADKPKPQCPQVAIVRALEKAVDHGGEAATPENLVSTGALLGIEGACSFEDKGVDVNFALALGARKGPRLGGDRVSFPYFVSVVDATDKVTAKELMTAEFSFSGDKKIAELTQPLHVFIPLQNLMDAGAMRVLVGFQLTESQLKAASARPPQ